MSLLKVNEVQNYNGSSLTLTASTVSTSAQLNTGGNISVTGSINVSDDSTTRSNLGLGSIATQDSDNVTVTGGTATLGVLTVSGSDSGDLVRITQTGSGNALVVEDDTNPDSTPFVVDASGNVGVGTDSVTLVGGSKAVDIVGQFSAFCRVKRSSATTSEGGVWASAGAINVGSSVVGGGVLSLVTENTERMRIDSGGDIYSTAWTIKIWTLGGVSSTSATVYRGGYKRIGKMVYVHGYVQGVSNANTFTITNLPYAPKNDALNVSYQTLNVAYAVNGSVVTSSPVTAIVNGNQSSTDIVFRINHAVSTWATSGNKAAIFSGWYEAETI